MIRVRDVLRSSIKLDFEQTKEEKKKTFLWAIDVFNTRGIIMLMNSLKGC
jgi:hypothetical protein